MMQFWYWSPTGHSALASASRAGQSANGSGMPLATSSASAATAVALGMWHEWPACADTSAVNKELLTLAAYDSTKSDW